MANNIIEILKKIITDNGVLIYKSENQLEALLKDYCNGEDKKEIMALMLVIEEGITEKIAESKDRNMLNEHIKLICDSAPISEEAAAWAVYAWYYALGILGEADIAKYKNSDSEKIGADIITDNNEASKLYNFDEITDEQIQEAYKILELKNTAKEADIIKSHRKLIKKYYPPKFKDLGLRKMAEEKTNSINSAKEILKVYLSHEDELKLSESKNINSNTSTNINTNTNIQQNNKNNSKIKIQNNNRNHSNNTNNANINLGINPLNKNITKYNYKNMSDKKKARQGLIIISVFVILLLLIAPRYYDSKKDTNVSSQSGSSSLDNIVFKDKSIEMIIRNKIHKTKESPITNSDLQKITALSIQHYSGSDISDLKHLTNLTKLTFKNSTISDISPLKNLSSLSELNLSYDEISDTRPLTDLDNLTYLNLSGNKIIDIEPLSNLSDLTQLYLSNNHISDIGSLAFLTDLTYLDISKNKIDDISLLAQLTKLTQLHLSNNPIENMSVLQNFTDLEYVFVSKSQLFTTNINSNPEFFVDPMKCHVLMDFD